MSKKFKIDFSNIPDNVVPEGTYTATINKVELKEGTKAPYLNWEFDIMNEGYEDRKVWLITSLADNALFRLKQVAENLGFEGGFDFETNENNFVVEPQLAGTEVSISVVHREYNGQTRASVETILDYFTENHLGEAPDDDEEEDEFDDFEDEFDDLDDLDEDEDEPESESEPEPEAAIPASPGKKSGGKASKPR